MLTITHKGNFESTTKFLSTERPSRIRKALEKYGKIGVEALEEATPKDTGLTSRSWGFDVVETKTGISVVWKNSNVVDGVPIALIIQYGHATRNGGYVQGRDYINPALQPVFDDILKNVWKEVSE